MLFEAMVFLASALIIAYIVLIFVKANKASYQGKQAVYDLSQENQLVLPTDHFIWSDSACSIRFAIYVKHAPRTISKVDCIPSHETMMATSFAPNCNDYSYHPCKCDGSNCTSCSINGVKNGLSKLLNISDNIELWASGYTNQNDKPYVPALLKIRTGSTSNNIAMESISLPAIPLQKWTVVTIVKEGRRFDVYYGSKLQTSKLTDYVPVKPSATEQWIAGNSAWKGEIGFFMGFNKALNADDVLADVENIINTRGVPFYMDTMDFTIPFPVISGCFFGILGKCDRNLPDVKPKNPFSVFSSSYQ